MSIVTANKTIKALLDPAQLNAMAANGLPTEFRGYVSGDDATPPLL